MNKVGFWEKQEFEKLKKIGKNSINSYIKKKKRKKNWLLNFMTENYDSFQIYLVFFAKMWANLSYHEMETYKQVFSFALFLSVIGLNVLQEVSW